jgi:hypothetical protein
MAFMEKPFGARDEEGAELVFVFVFVFVFVLAFALSIMSNIAEGYLRRSPGSSRIVLRVATGSNGEARAFLHVASDRVPNTKN